MAISISKVQVNIVVSEAYTKKLKAEWVTINDKNRRDERKQQVKEFHKHLHSLWSDYGVGRHILYRSVAQAEKVHKNLPKEIKKHTEVVEFIGVSL